MNATTFRTVVSAMALLLVSGAAWSGDTAGNSITALKTDCGLAQPPAASVLLWNASTTARHTNVSRVRYSAAHALPAARGPATTGAACPPGSTPKDFTSLD